MGAIRYQTNGFSIDGIEYRISIYDKSYSGAIVSDFILDSNFFELRYDSGADENYSPIIGSELTLNIELFKSPARNDTTLFTFLKNMIAQNSQTYYIIIEEKVSGSYVNYWRGNVVQDQSTWNNDALEGGKSFKVTANDFAFLNELPFELLSIASPKVVAEYPLRSLMNAALTKLGIYDDFSGDILYYFLHNINWYETTIPLLDRPNTDILYDILTNDSNFTELNEDETINTINYIEVLKTICIIFGCRLIQSNGKFWAIQMSNYANTTSKFWQRGIDNNNNTIVTVSPRVAVDNTSGPLKILEGGSYAGIRPYYTVFAEKPSLDTLVIPTNQKDPFTINHMFSTKNGILFAGGNNNKLKINLSTETLNKNPHSTVRDTIPTFSIGNFDLKVSKTDFIAQIIKVRIKTTAGVYWYLNDNGTNLFWSTTLTTGFVSFETYFFAIGKYNGIMDSTLITSAMPSYDFNEIYIEAFIHMEGYVDIGGTDYHTTSAVETFFTGSMDCKFLENGTDENEKTTYRATISPKPFDPTEKQIEKMYLYDTQQSKNKGTMYVNYGANPVTNDWIVGTASASTYNILELVVLNALAQNRAVKEIITATIKGNYYPHQLLTYDSKQWHLKQCTYNAGSNQWNGEWWELQYDETNITTVANEADGDWQDTVLIG
jgi:hypothetical protein